MILQGSFDLKIEDENVYATIDFDTGLIGFVEKEKDVVNEYSYQQGPIRFRIALVKKLMDSLLDSTHINTKICRKNNAVIKATEILRNQ